MGHSDATGKPVCPLTLIPNKGVPLWKIPNKRGASMQNYILNPHKCTSLFSKKFQFRIIYLYLPSYLCWLNYFDQKLTSDSLALNPPRPCSSFPNAGVTGMHQHTWLRSFSANIGISSKLAWWPLQVVQFCVSSSKQALFFKKEEKEQQQLRSNFLKFLIT